MAENAFGVGHPQLIPGFIGVDQLICAIVGR